MSSQSVEQEETQLGRCVTLCVCMCDGEGKYVCVLTERREHGGESKEEKDMEDALSILQKTWKSAGKIES